MLVIGAQTFGGANFAIIDPELGTWKTNWQTSDSILPGLTYIFNTAGDIAVIQVAADGLFSEKFVITRYDVSQNTWKTKVTQSATLGSNWDQAAAYTSFGYPVLHNPKWCTYRRVP